MMRIKKVLKLHRQVFTAIFVCEICQVEEEKDGYDEGGFYRNVIPKMKCKSCEAVSPKSDRPLTAKHLEGEQL